MPSTLVIWRRKWQPTPAFLPGESHGQRSLVGYCPWGRRESDTTEWLSLTHSFTLNIGLIRWLSGNESACQVRRCRRCGFKSWVRKIPWRVKWQPISVFLLGKSHGQRNLVGYSPWVCKESDMTEHLSIHECTASYIKTGIFWPTQHMQRKRKHFLKISPLKNEIFINDEDKNSQNQKLWIKGFS